MEEKSTKEKIFDVSLELFSQKGFSNTSVREIAKNVGIKESSIYNHYNSKQAILDDILDTFTLYFEGDAIGELELNTLLETNPELFYHQGSQSFRELIKNEKIMKILRLLFIQMYQDDQLANYFQKTLLDGPLDFWTMVFTKLMEKKVIKEGDPRVLARNYYGYTIFLLLEVFIKNNSFPDEELDRIFSEAEEHAISIINSVRLD